MGLFTKAEFEQINAAAKKSKQDIPKPKKAAVTKKSAANELERISAEVKEYFKDSDAILITSAEQLNEYADKCIEAKYVGIDTETTGLDRINDTIVGFSLYYPGGVQAYIPNKHLIYIFDEYYKDQVSYEDSGKALQKMVDGGVKFIFANADFDLSMIYKDFGVDLTDNFFYDVILAWRCLKENELRNGLKELYNKYVLKGKGSPKKFSDFFSPDLFPYCDPEIAKLYAANDAQITYELFLWQLPYTLPNNEKCKKNHLERISDIIWNLEFPMVKVCAMMHRNGIYLDNNITRMIQDRYHTDYDSELSELRKMVQQVIDDKDTPYNTRRPFKTGDKFNPDSTKHVSYLLYDLMKLPNEKGGTGKDIIREFAIPETDKILKVRSLSTLIGTFVDKLPESVASDNRVHPTFRSVGASTGRMSSRDPNCIANGTRIACPDGDKTVENINVGDKVYCYDLEAQRIVVSEVLNKWYKGTQPCDELSYEGGSVILTNDHPVYTQNRGYVKVNDLKDSDIFVQLTSDGTTTTKLIPTPISIKPAGNREVYDIEVDVHHNFVANGIVLKNCQNIPSHATDIRHMFRATSAIDKQKEFTTDNSIVLPGVHFVPNEDSNLIEVMNLEVGMRLKLHDEHTDVVKTISNIEKIDSINYRIEVM